VLEAPEQDYASEPAVPRRRAVTPTRKLRQDFSDDFADDLLDEDDAPVTRRRPSAKTRFRGLPATKWGRIAVGVAFLVLIGICAGVAMIARNMLLHDDRFVIQSSSSIEIEGNNHLTRAQLLSIFGGDVERNIFNVSLAERRAQLEGLPWVEHATVMRLLPNRMRVSIMERTPVAFVRQGSHIGLVDGSGVLLDMPTGTSTNTHYSFPVVTGILADEPLSTRAARMKIFARFTSELDSSGEKISQSLSEVDLSNPEDVKALIPDHSADVLVHFGEENFLDRYRKYEAHLAEWRTQYPRLSSVDMRYERQVVLETGPMAPVTTPTAIAENAQATPEVPAVTAPVAKAPLVATKHPVGARRGAAKTKSKAAIHAPHHVAAKSGAAPKARAKQGDVAVWVHPKPGTKLTGVKRAAAPSTATHPQYHPPQVVRP
jgi:cell division protein FtsQ